MLFGTLQRSKLITKHIYMYVQAGRVCTVLVV